VIEQEGQLTPEEAALEVRRLAANEVDEILNVGILVYSSKCHPVITFFS
jgi:hypothetical protein